MDAQNNFIKLDSYPKIYNLGHPDVAYLLDDEVVVQEKIDGSQIGFAIREGSLLVRSKGAILNLIAPEKMFSAGIDSIKSRESLLNPSFVYRGEYLMRPKHNVLAYAKIPRGHVAIFDIWDSINERFLTQAEIETEAARLEFDSVPCFFIGEISSEDQFRSFLQSESFLGEQQIEGVVIKNYLKTNRDGKTLMGKFVSESFREIHKGDWREKVDSKGDILSFLTEKYRTPARWQKAMLHLKERGKILDSPKDIPTIMQEVMIDTVNECEGLIKQDLFDWAIKSLRKELTRGIPDWYKDTLLKKQFEKE